MQNVRGVPQGRNNLTKEDRIQEEIDKHKPDLIAALETGIYDNKRPPIPLKFDKVLYNNIVNYE